MSARTVKPAKFAIFFCIFQGKIIVKEHLTHGFENFPKAFVELFTGDNFGKAAVIVSNKSKL